MFVTFSGIDGSGKSTQIQILKEYLESHGIGVWTTSEPTNSPIGSLIRDYLRLGGISDEALACLYLADRIEHVKQIKEHLSRGEWVLSDRYKDCSLAYQGTLLEGRAHGLFLESNNLLLKPDLSILLDISVETSLKRITIRNKEKEIFEKEDFLKKVKESYIRIFKNSPNHYIVEAEKDVYTVNKEIVKIIQKKGSKVKI